jgi:DnaJ-class molecular chaperone
MKARLTGALIRCQGCGGSGRWLTPMHTVRPCPCCAGAGDVPRDEAARALATCLACRGRGAIGGEEAAVCPICRGFGAVAVRNRVVAGDVELEGAAA